MVTIDIVDNYFDHYKRIKYDESNLAEPIEWYHTWYDSALELFSLYFQPGDVFFDKFISVDNRGNGFDLYSNFNAIRSAYMVLANRIKSNMKEEGIVKGSDKKKVFVVHGHNNAVKEEVARFLEHLKLSPIILHEQVDRGRTIIEKFEANAEDVDFAVILLTADDKGMANNGDCYNSRARQNVIFEMGYFIGKLSREHVFLLLETGVEEPSDLEGVVYTSLSDNWKIKLFKELQECGYKIDPNDLL